MKADSAHINNNLDSVICDFIESGAWESAVRRTERASRRLLKRFFDLSLGAVALIVFAAPMLLIALAIRLDSSGPAVFKQQRVGRRGRPFVFYKFRTMAINNDDAAHRAYIKKLITANQGYAGLKEFKITNDRRVTRVGRFLRFTSLDELMQLFNVIKGDMSLVGPRPALPYEVELFSDEQRERLVAKPGITGLWQVSGRNTVGFTEMIKLDLEYIYRWSLWLDMVIIAKTVPALIKTRGW